MRNVHYFQRFSKPEDVYTNNALLLLKRLQHHDPRLLEGLLRELLATTDLTIGAELTQQETVEKTIADGMIRQRSFHIIVETKRHASFDKSQISGHLSAFKEATADIQVILLLGTQEPANRDEIQAAVDAFNGKNKRSVGLAWTTFSQLADVCRDLVPEHDREMVELLDDFEDFCSGEGLLAESDAEMLVVGCSRSIRDNLELRLYYDSRRSHRPAKYLGFYERKAVRTIGTLTRVVQVELDRGLLKVAGGQPLSDDESQRIREAMRRAPEYGWNIEKNHYFFLAGALAETNFVKETKYPLWNRKYFDLRKLLSLKPKERLPGLEDLSARLSARRW